MREKIIEIITNTQTNCVGKDCNKCNYSGQEHCLINRVADELIKNHVIKKRGKWITSIMGCVINCSNCGERLELCYPDGTEVRELPYCPYCGAQMEMTFKEN